MNVDLEQFFFWCLVINAILYSMSALAVWLLKDFICSIFKGLFEMDRSETLKALQTYLAHYKLFIMVFNFTPWLVLLILG
ncbi:DUF6868 family protein [Coraliomargarita parva]|uniref:DUF6868 family protein n=1 Tax=Coraliomargarita parva TaxID=3014050 RepID=UPI0022B5A140|nr:hypothetical protein [Coraliomargarita parva]